MHMLGQGVVKMPGAGCGCMYAEPLGGCQGANVVISVAMCPTVALCTNGQS